MSQRTELEQLVLQNQTRVFSLISKRSPRGYLEAY